MQGTTRSELNFLLMAILFLCPVDVLGHHFVLCFNRHQNAFKVFASFSSELIEWHWSIED